MQNVQIVNQYINHVPWRQNPAFAFGDDADKYEKAFQTVIEYVPDTNNKILFEDDVWNFLPFFKDINSRNYKIRFNADDDYKDYLKFFVIYSIGRTAKITTVSKRVRDFIGIIASVKKASNHNMFSLITTDDLVDLIENRDVSSSRRHSMFASLHIIYSFIIKNYRLELPINISTLLEKSSYYRNRATKECEKTPNIPEEYYIAIINKASEVLDNESLPINSRMTAGLIILASQTGLRVQDLTGLKSDALQETQLPVSGMICHYLHYQARKPTKAHSQLLEFDIYASQLCIDTFKKMNEIRKNCEFSSEPYLYILPSGQRSENIFPVAMHRVHKEYKRFFYNYLFSEAQKSWEGVEPVVYNLKSPPSKLSIPKLKQFRVHLATSLYNAGIPLTYIQKYLGHLSEYMLGYYVRQKENSVENAKYSQHIIQKIVGEKTTPLGNMGEQLRKKLCEFVENGNYNVETDAAQIVNDLGEKLVIREKGPGLCCIKANFIPCKFDVRTNEILCAYGMCPNIYHFYDMIGVTVMQFHAMQETYQENLNNGFTRAAQKELQKIKDFIRRRLSLELKEFYNVIQKAGLEKFCTKHPDLAEYAHNYNQLLEEMKLWENY